MGNTPAQKRQKVIRGAAKRRRVRRRAPYETYIASKAWAERRSEYFSRYAKRCRRCGTTRRIHLHHQTYARLGRERDDDLVPLCEPCHAFAHRLHKALGGSLTEATRTAIASEPERVETE